MRGGAPPCHGRARPRPPVTANGQGLTEWWVQVKRTGWCRISTGVSKRPRVGSSRPFPFLFSTLANRREWLHRETPCKVSGFGAWQRSGRGTALDLAEDLRSSSSIFVRCSVLQRTDSTGFLPRSQELALLRQVRDVTVTNRVQSANILARQSDIVSAARRRVQAPLSVS